MRRYVRTNCQKKALLNSKRPLPKYTLKSLREKLLLKWIYHSNAIEGNTLTINETKMVLEGITVGGKTLREHLEIINHREAIAYVEEIVHNAGVYRDQQVFIPGASHVPPASYLIQEHME